MDQNEKTAERARCEAGETMAQTGNGTAQAERKPAPVEAEDAS